MVRATIFTILHHIDALPRRLPAPTLIHVRQRSGDRRRHVHETRSWRLLVLAFLLVPVIVTTEPSAGAQSQLVLVTVRTRPALPQPGDDVTVAIRISGCPPGDAQVELYLTTDDGATASAALMARSPAITSLVFRAHANVVMPNAIEGWYGVRVVCGAFRPARRPMANTTFAVGANPTKQSRLVGTSVQARGTISMVGNGCPGPTVEYAVSQVELHDGPFVVAGTIPVGADGNWSGDVRIPDSIVPGSAQVKRRCVLQNQRGQTVTIDYPPGPDLLVTPAPPPTTAPP